MKKLIIGLVLAGACSRSTTTAGTPAAPAAPAGGSTTGAASERDAVTAFMTAINTGDLQAIGAIWGDESGPARNRWQRDELEQRELIMQRCLRHDRFKILGDPTMVGGQRTFSVELVRKGLTASTTLIAVRGPGGRWYVKQADIETPRQICAQS